MPNNPRGLELTCENKRKFKAIVARETRWLPVIAQIDPDGLGSNFGKKEIIEQLGGEADWPYYGGRIDDPQNKHVIEVMRLEKKLRPLSELPAEGAITLNDSCRLRDNRFGVEIDTRRIKDVTDHHLPRHGAAQLERKWRFVHIVHDVGAASTIVVEQGRALGTRFSKLAATLLALGIHNDTDKLRSPATTDADRRAFAEMAAIADQKKLAECHDYPLEDRYFELTAKTYLGRRMIGPALVAHPNRRMHTEESGYISRNVNRLRQHPACRIAIAWCLTGTHVRFSVRAKDMGCDLNGLIDEVFGKGNGGGKHGSGGGTVALDQLPIDPKSDFDDEMIVKIDRYLERRLERYFRKTPT